MRKLTFLSILILSVWGPMAAADLSLGDPMPQDKANIKMQNIDDTKVSISDANKGKDGMLVVFSCNHCPYARAWEARIVQIAANAKSKNVGFIMINSNDPTQFPDDGFATMKTKKYSFPYVVDATSELARSFGATKTPDVFLFDKKGVLVYKGAVDDNSESADKVTKHFLQDALDQMTGGQKIAMAETKAIGCGIKLRK